MTRITIALETDTPTGYVEWSWHSESGSHAKSRARTIADALVQVAASMREARSIPGQRVLEVRLPGPSGAAINRAKRCGCRGTSPYSYSDDSYKEWRRDAAWAVESAVEESKWRTVTTACAVEVVAYWPTLHRRGDADGMPRGDVDAPAKAVLDALQAGGAVSDDTLFTRATLEKAHAGDEDPYILVRVHAEDA